jgi:hypothetical protein
MIFSKFRAGLVPGLAIAAAAVASPALADRPIETGADLHDVCSRATAPGDASMAEARCQDYLSGFMQAMLSVRAPDGTTRINRIAEPAESFCYKAPEKITWKDMQSAVVSYGETHPEVMDEPAPVYLALAMGDVFPC